MAFTNQFESIPFEELLYAIQPKCSAASAASHQPAVGFWPAKTCLFAIPVFLGIGPALTNLELRGHLDGPGARHLLEPGLQPRGQQRA